MGRWDNNQKQKSKIIKMIFFVAMFAILGFVVGETLGQYVFHQSAFGFVDTTPLKPFVSTIPPNYFTKPVPVTPNVITVPSPYKVIGLKLSNACLAALKTNSTTCPSYKDFLYADNSNYLVSGNFGMVNGVYQRIAKNHNQNFNYYESLNHFTVLVDPPKDIADKIPIIEIYSQLPVYADLHGTDLDSKNGIRTLHQYRFVVDCQSLTAITFSKLILNDTISFVQSGCKNTNLVTEIKITTPQKYTDPTTTAIYKYQQSLKLEKSLISSKDCRYAKCDVSVTGKKW